MNRAVSLVVLLVLAAGILQGTWIRGLAVGGLWPDVVLVCVVLVGLLRGLEAGLAAGLAGGLLMGWLAGLAAPAFLFSRLTVGLGTGWARSHWHRDNLVVQIAAVALGSIVAEGLFLLLYPAALDTPMVGVRIALQTLLNLAIAPLVAVVAGRLPQMETGVVA